MNRRRLIWPQLSLGSAGSAISLFSQYEQGHRWSLHMQPRASTRLLAFPLSLSPLLMNSAPSCVKQRDCLRNLAPRGLRQMKLGHWQRYQCPQIRKIAGVGSEHAALKYRVPILVGCTVKISSFVRYSSYIGGRDCSHEDLLADGPVIEHS